jgi:hypothetical protein
MFYFPFPVDVVSLQSTEDLELNVAAVAIVFWNLSNAFPTQRDFSRIP